MSKAAPHILRGAAVLSAALDMIRESEAEADKEVIQTIYASEADLRPLERIYARVR